jgi:hypothetical protein
MGSHTTVGQDHTNASQVADFQLYRTTADEHRIRDIAQWLIDKDKTVSYQSCAAYVNLIIYNEEDIEDKDGLTVSHIGCIKVDTLGLNFNILPNSTAWIHPIDSQVRSYPIPGELVVIVNYGRQTFYFQPLNILNRVNHNIMLNFPGTSKSPKTTTENVDEFIHGFDYKTNPRPVKQYPGDWAINGRNDQSIRIGTSKITETEDTVSSDNAVIKMRITDKETKPKMTGTPKEENINSDKSSFWMVRNEKIPIKAEAKTLSTSKDFTGNQIMINSDQITLNTISGSAGELNLFAGNTTNIVSKNNTYIIGSMVKIGDEDDNNLQSAVLGESLVNFLAEMIQTLDSFAGKIAGISGIGNIGGLAPIPGAMGAGSALGGWTSISQNKQFIRNRILSKNVKVSKKARQNL